MMTQHMHDALFRRALPAPARIIHEPTRALAGLLSAQGIFLCRSYGSIRRSIGKSTVRTRSCAIITRVHKLSGLVALLAMALLSGCSADDQAASNERRFAVTLIWPEVREIEALERTVGRLEALETPVVAAETAGRVLVIHEDAGARVEQGDLLLTLDDESQRHAVAALQAELRRLDALLSNQRVQVDRLRDLARRQSVAQDQLDQAETMIAVYQAQHDEAQSRLSQAELELSRTRVRSPVTGQVQQRLVSAGDFVAAGRAVFELVAVDALQAVLPLPEQFQDQLTVGQSVYLAIPARPYQRLRHEITEILPRVGQRSRAVDILITLENPGHWRPGGSVVGEVILDRRESVMVPLQAVVRRPVGSVVFVYDGAGRVNQRPVETGLRDNGWIEIRSGLTADEAVVVDGAGFLSDDVAVDVRDWLPASWEAAP